jgi:hypothetical protein
MTHEEALGLVPQLAAGAIEGLRKMRLEEHLTGCADCRRSLEDWRRVGAAVRQASPAIVQPPPALLQTVIDQVARPAAAHSLALSAQLLAAQAPVVRRQIWSASAVVMAIGFAMALLSGRDGAGSLAAIAPLIAAAGIAFIYGPGNDPPLEIMLAAPTSPRVILLARLVLVFGYDLLLALAASIGLALVGRGTGGFEAVILLWIGPMLLLSALSLAVAVRFGSAAGVGLAIGLWALQLGPAHVLERFTERMLSTSLASTNLVTVCTALLIFAAVFIRLPREPRLA